MLKIKSGLNTSADQKNHSDKDSGGQKTADGAARPSLLSALKIPLLFPSDDKVLSSDGINRQLGDASQLMNVILGVSFNRLSMGFVF